MASINGDSKPPDSGSTVSYTGKKTVDLGVVELFGLHLLCSHIYLAMIYVSIKFRHKC